MFLIALNRKLREDNWFTKNDVKEPNLINYLDLVSLGTVCDVVPLIGLNRAIVKQGLKTPIEAPHVFVFGYIKQRTLLYRLSRDPSVVCAELGLD